MDLFRRSDWRGQPIELGFLFRVVRDNREAGCILQTHELGWELRLIIGRDTVSSRVCHTREDVLSTSEKWKAALCEKGWQ